MYQGSRCGPAAEQASSAIRETDTLGKSGLSGYPGISWPGIDFKDFFMHIQWHELEYTGKGAGVLHILLHTQLWQNLHFSGEWLATSLALELEKPQTAQCAINWRAHGSGGLSPGLLPPRKSLYLDSDFNSRSTNLIHCVVSVQQKSNVLTVVWSDSRAATEQESSSWQDD